MPSLRSVLHVAFLAGLAAWIGCEQPNHRAAIERREQYLQRTATMLAAMENERPANMRGTLAMLQQQHANDIERSSRSPEELDRAIRAEFDRWTQRLPDYRKRFEELMQGNPANIDYTLPYMIY